MGRSSGRNIKKALSSSTTLSRIKKEALTGADPVWWERFSKNYPYLIHVTHRDAIEGIKEKGVIPSPSNWDEGNSALSSRPGYTYFALPRELNDIIAYYQDPVYLSGDEYVDEDEWRELNPQYDELFVVVIETSDLKPEHIAADEDCLHHIFESSEAFPRDPEEIDPEIEFDNWHEMDSDEQDKAFEELLSNMQSLGEWAEEFMSDRLSDPEMIQKHVTNQGKLAYKGGVDSQLIVKILTPEEAAEQLPS